MSIVISKEKDDDHRLYVDFNNNKNRGNKIQNIEGIKWEDNKKLWSVPNTKQIIDKIVLTFYDEEVVLDASLI